MTETEIPVDLLNPGQVFACLGLMEAAEILIGPCEGRFAYQDHETQARFHLSVEGDVDAIRAAVSFLSAARPQAIAPKGSGLTTEKWGVASVERDDETYPAPAPPTPASLAVVLKAEDREIPIGHWLDGRHCGRDNVKFWGGSGGYPGAALARDALALLPRSDNAIAAAAADPFAFSAPMSSSFRLDWRHGYVPLDTGFSLNEHKSTMKPIGYPLVELLAAIGLQHARPARETKLLYRYGVGGVALPTLFARAVLGGADLGFPTRIFRMSLDWPGQEGQARCIVEAREEENAQ